MIFPSPRRWLVPFLAFALHCPAEEAELAAIRQRVVEATRQLGDQAGVPEEADTFLRIPTNGRWLTPAEAKAGFAKAPAMIEKVRWWKIGLDPAGLQHALREPASIVSAGAQAALAGLDGAARSLELAREAGDFLIWAQAQGGRGLYPFPAARGGKSKAFLAADRLLDRAAREGRTESMIEHGWAVDDLQDGGLQFDNGEAGVAMLELYRATGEGKYLDSARKAADWAITRPIVANWNYNSFSVHLLAKAYATTGEQKYLEAATRKARLGVIPGQLTEGPRAGRWVDRHNAKPAYHYIIVRALAALAVVLPTGDPARPEVMQCLQLGLRARNVDFTGPGAANKDKAMEALVLVNRTWAHDPALLRETGSADALDALGKLVSEQFRRGSSPLGPREWALFLAFAVERQ